MSTSDKEIQKGKLTQALAEIRIGFIGYGNMAQAIAVGLVKAGMPGSHINACARTWDKLQTSTGKIGAIACRDAREVAQQSDIVFIAVKPGIVEAACAPIANDLADKIVVSVAWCVNFDDYERFLAPGTAHVGTIPNIPVCVDEGIWLVADHDSLTPEQRELVDTILGATGMIARLPESQMNAAGTITSCAPAYAAMFVEALGDAAVKHGIPRALSYQLAEQMVAGTGSLLVETGQHPAALKDAVCSPGGATIRGVAALEDAGLRSAAIKAIDAVLG